MFLQETERSSSEILVKIREVRAILSSKLPTSESEKQADTVLSEIELGLRPRSKPALSPRFFQTILDELPLVVCHVDKNLNYVYANEAFKVWYGVDCQEIVGRSVGSIIGAQAFAKVKPYIDLALSGEEQEFEIELDNREGGTRWLHAHYIPIRQADRTIVGFTAIIENISERLKQSELIKSQRSFYSKILNSMEEGFAIQDKDAHIIHFNPAAMKILGLTEDQLLGRTSLDPRWRAIHEDGSPFPGETHPAMVAIRTGKADIDRVMGIVTPDERLRWLKVSAIPFHAEFEGKQAVVLVTFSDITNQIERNQFLSNIMTNSPGVIYKYCLDHEGNISIPFMSAKAVEIYEKTADEIKSNSGFLFEIMKPKDRELVAKLIKESAENLSIFHWNGEIKTPSEKMKWISVTGIPFSRGDGSVVWDGIVLDQTKQHLLEEQLSKEQANSIHAMRLSSLGEMSAGIAHEINNPLAIVAGLVPMLPKLVQDPIKFEDKLGKINQAVDRIAKIVRGLKKFSRTDSERSKDILSLSALIRESMVFTEIQAKRANVSIETQLDDQLFIQANEVEIEQVLINLMNNAIDAVKALPKKWVKIETKKTNSHVVLRITDAGTGIPPALAEKIFDPFFTTKDIGQGTGLGLSISRGIIQEHGGDISILSDRPNTCFEIRFPLVTTNAS